MVCFGVFEVNLRSGELRKQGLKVKLQEKPFQLLAALLDRAGEIITREELRQRLWPADTYVVFDDNLNAAVRRLREVLGDDADNPRFVETLPRRGYRFIAPAQTVEPVASALPARRRWLTWATAAAMFALALPGTYFAWQHLAAGPTQTSQRLMLAVLP
ncbi:MAG: winged helix-turn-helix domain-containing protein [Acidobacteria bacterium]|nr:winged helix-turn-helix domain-containing protein [Acidobacteriota bacterium]